MNWWQKLQENPLAKWSAILLLTLYIIVIGADFFAPYDPYSSLPNTSLLPPTKIYWTDQKAQKKWLSPHVYPTTQGATDINTGERLLTVQVDKPVALGLLVKGTPYQVFKVSLPLPPTWENQTLFEGWRFDRHLFGVKEINSSARLNLLGTDEQGRDQFSRLIFGGKVSLFIGLLGIIFSYPLGMIIGGISGYFGGWIDIILMRLVEVLMTIPTLYLLVSLGAVLPPKISNTQRFFLIVLITSLVSWAALARIIRGQVLSIKEQEYIQAVKTMGGKPFYIITRHILPQTASYIVISATLTIPGFIVSESVLSLLGLGIQQPDASWGNLLSIATNASILVLQPWLVWSPAVLLIITVLAFNLIGDSLRDALDPRSLGRKE